MTWTLIMDCRGTLSSYTANYVLRPYPKTAWRVCIWPGFKLGHFQHRRAITQTLPK